MKVNLQTRWSVFNFLSSVSSSLENSLYILSLATLSHALFYLLFYLCFVNMLVYAHMCM